MCKTKKDKKKSRLGVAGVGRAEGEDLGFTKACMHFSRDESTPASETHKSNRFSYRFRERSRESARALRQSPSLTKGSASAKCRRTGQCPGLHGRSRLAHPHPARTHPPALPGLPWAEPPPRHAPSRCRFDAESSHGARLSEQEPGRLG